LAQTGCWKSGRACLLCPGISDINLFRYCQGIIYFDAEISDSQKLDSPEIARAPVDQRGFRASQLVRPEQSWVQSNTADPLGNEARILARCHVSFGTTTTREQELAGPLVGGL
jgi:hypothetical protein